MSKKMNGFKRTLMAAVCAPSVMATAIPVSAAEMVDPAVIAQLEDSISVAASCSCAQDWQFMSRQCSRIDGNTHMAYYTFYYECIHGIHRKVDEIKENHSYGGYVDGGHVKDERKHQWNKECACGNTSDVKIIECYGDVNGGSHARL